MVEGHFLKPAGRHLLTIGRDLIQDQYAAIVELVKNSFDADASRVDVKFFVQKEKFTIVVEDDGHGMTKDTVINKWLVPSTDDKLKRKISPSGRNMQGRKGVGRYAASILGDSLLLETVDDSKKKTSIYVNWQQFEKAEYLSDVEVLVETSVSEEKKGTRLTIDGGLSYVTEWDDKQFIKLKYELKKLISPFKDTNSGISEHNNFDICLSFYGFDFIPDTEKEEIIEPYPIVELFDYKISGNLDRNGKGHFLYENQKSKNTLKEQIYIDLGRSTGCGSLTFDIRVYDRESEAIDQLIQRGLKDEQGSYLGKLQARQLLNEYNGIAVYRNGFRIRPLGDPEFDWLRLNDQRVQNPSLRVGGNQVIGYVQIESEELSNLEEKSARDGLKENSSYLRLKEISKDILEQLEQRRYGYRKKEGLGRKTLKIESALQKLFEFDELKDEIRNKLNKEGVDQNITDEIISKISDSEEKKNKIIVDVKNAVAVYQGQATLGKIINVILHEGRRPLNYFKNQISNFEFWATEFKTNLRQESLDEIIPIISGIGQNAKIFVNLFGRLDPLAAGKRGEKKKLFLLNELISIKGVFENELIQNHIECIISGNEDSSIYGWNQDLYAIFTNLIDNSIFWIKEKDSKNRKITIDIVTNGDQLAYIDYRDTGPGIERHLIESQLIFDPEFTTKKNGNGLGLAIAGEAATRNSLELKAFDSETGAYFRLQPITVE